MQSPWYWQHFNHQIYPHKDYRLAVRVFFAPGRAPEADGVMRGLNNGMGGNKLKPHLTAHNSLTLYHPNDVYTYLMRACPSPLMEQALEEYLAASGATCRGRASTPAEHVRQVEAVRRVMALAPPPWVIPFKRPKRTKGKRRSKSMG
jgi:hypothetical protein